MTRRRTPFGSCYQPIGAGLGRWAGLGAIPAETQSALMQNVEPLFSYLDAIGSRINDAAQVGIDDATLEAMRARRDELRSGLVRLSDNIDALQTEDDVRVWETGYVDLRAHIVELDAQIVRTLRGQQESKLWQVGLWTAGAVLTVGAVVIGVRLLARRRRR